MRLSSRITWYLALVAAGAAAVAGILVGHHRNRKAPALRWAGSMRFVRTPPPTARGPGRGPANLAFTSPRLGFAATTGGAHDVPRVGWAPPTDVGRMQRTDDGGATWKTLWSGRRIAFDGIAVLGQTVVASAAVNPRDHGIASSGRLLLASHDGGRTWREKRPPPGDAAVQPMTSRIWIASSPRSVYPDEHGATLFRSGDGGANWRRLAVPRAAELVRFATPSLGFASAYAQTCQSLRKRWTSIYAGYSTPSRNNSPSTAYMVCPISMLRSPPLSKQDGRLPASRSPMSATGSS